MTKLQINAIKARQRIGKRIASKAVMMDPITSKVENKGFPIPAVEIEDFTRKAAVVP